jgi:hypothetical protein
MSYEYRIGALKDFLAVPAESIDACLADFKVWLEIARARDEFSADMSELLGVPEALSFSDDGFTWLDDGIPRCRHIDIVDASDDSPIGRISFEEPT